MHVAVQYIFIDYTTADQSQITINRYEKAVTVIIRQLDSSILETLTNKPRIIKIIAFSSLSLLVQSGCISVSISACVKLRK